ncbi:MAG: T9SS type A sorting domain-containing protein [Aquirufa sp.]
MNKLFKISLSIALTLVSAFAFSQTTPLINGASSVKMNGVNTYSVFFTVSGCASGYDWSATNNQGVSDNLASSWDVAYGAPSTTTVSTVALGNNANNSFWIQDPNSPYQYTVQCVGATTPSDPKATVQIYVLPQPVNEWAPPISVVSRQCAYIDNPTGGVVRLKADGCYDEVEWTKPNGTTEVVWAEFDGILTLSGNYDEGVYRAKCRFNALYKDSNNTTVTVYPVTQGGSSFVGKEYYPPQNIQLTSTAALGAGWTEICDGTSIDLKPNISDAYAGKMTYQWFRNNTLIGSNNTGVFNTGGSGNYFVRVASKSGAGACGFSDSNIFNINKVGLDKPVILGNNKYCLDGVTTLNVDSTSLIKREGYLMPAKPTAPASFTWYVNGVAQSNLGILSSIKANTNISVQVSYTTNYGCKSAISDAVAVTNYDRPATPSITAKTKLGWCFGTPIEAVLESSDLPNGETTKYEWSNKATGKTASINKDGSYTVRLINTDGCYSLASSPVVISVLPLPAAPTIATVNGASPFFCVKSESGTINTVSLVATSTNDVIWSTKFEGKVLADIKTSGTYTATVRDQNGCISLSSNSIKVVAQPNPALGSDTKILKEGVYTLKATNFPSAATVNATGAGEYVWKFGSALLTPKTYITKVKTAGDYTVARKYLYTIDGTPLTCITDAVKYTYAVDPDYSGVAVYPNPITAASSSDLTAKVQIQILEDWTNGEITLFDMVGRPVYAGKIANTDGTSILEVSGLANGIYILQIKADGGKSFVGKVIVNK